MIGIMVRDGWVGERLGHARLVLDTCFDICQSRVTGVWLNNQPTP